MIKLFRRSVEAKPPAARFGPLARSAFRTLGLRATATQAEVFDAASSLKLALRVGVGKSFDGDLVWLEPLSRTEADVRDAVGRLSEPKARALERVFWFHGRVTAGAVTGVEELARAADALLFDGSTEALHDAALLALAGVQRLDPWLYDVEAWTRAFGLWRRLFEGDEFWSRLVAADLRGDFEQLVTYAEAREVRGSAARLVSAPVAGFARDATLREDLRAAGRALGILRGAGLPPSLLAEYEREIVGPAEDSLISQLDAAFAWPGFMMRDFASPSTRRNYYNNAWRRFKAGPALRMKEFIAFADEHSARRAFEHAAWKLLKLGECFEAVGRRGEAAFVCLKARTLAPPDAEPMPAIEEKLRALGVEGEFRPRTWAEYAEQVARELEDAREPRRLFRDALRGDRRFDSSDTRRSSADGALARVLLLAVVVSFIFSLMRCGAAKNEGPAMFPPPTFTPVMPNLNFDATSLNLNFNIQALRPLAGVPEARARRTRKRGRSRNANSGESLLNFNAPPANSNAARAGSNAPPE